MTREEQEKHLDWLYRLRSEIYVYMPKEWLIPMNNALDMAIKALEQEPTTKNDKVDCKHTDCNNCVNHKYCDYEPTTKNDLGVDCISRDAVKYYIQAHIHEIITESGIDKNAHTNGVLRALLNGVDTMPSVTPQPTKGHWIWCVGSHKCSNCEEYTCFSHKELLRYCPNCGAKMVEPQENAEEENGNNA